VSNHDRAEVRNAADPKQVGRASRKEEDREKLFGAAMAAVMATQPGRLLVWSLLERASVFESIWSPDVKMHYRAGKQDFGHMIQAAALDAGEPNYELMEREARARKRRDNASTDAAHTPASSEGVQ